MAYRDKSKKVFGQHHYGSRLGERKVIERMFAIYEEGTGYSRVHQYLNEEGFTMRNGKPWTAAVVMPIMKREAYRLTRMTAIESISFDGPAKPVIQTLAAMTKVLPTIQ